MEFAADIDDLRAFLGEAAGMGDGAFGGSEIAAVGKAVGRHIDDAHDGGRVKRDPGNRRAGAGDGAEQPPDLRVAAFRQRARRDDAPPRAPGCALDHLEGEAGDRPAGNRQRRAVGNGDRGRRAPDKAEGAKVNLVAQTRGSRSAPDLNAFRAGNVSEKAWAIGPLERFPKSVTRFSDKKRDQAKN